MLEYNSKYNHIENKCLLETKIDSTFLKARNLLL